MPKKPVFWVRGRAWGVISIAQDYGKVNALAARIVILTLLLRRGRSVARPYRCRRGRLRPQTGRQRQLGAGLLSVSSMKAKGEATGVWKPKAPFSK